MSVVSMFAKCAEICDDCVMCCRVSHVLVLVERTISLRCVLLCLPIFAECFQCANICPKSYDFVYASPCAGVCEIFRCHFECVNICQVNSAEVLFVQSVRFVSGVTIFNLTLFF